MSTAQSIRGKPGQDGRRADARGVRLAVGALIALAGVTSVAFAQNDSNTAAQANSGTANQSSADSGRRVLVAQAAAGPAGNATQAQSGAAAGTQLEEVTVTAERIESSALRTPIAITALSTQQLTQTNVISTTDLKGLVPSLNVTQSGGYGENQMSIVIRGVGGEPRFFNQDNGIGFYIDDFYIPTGQNLNLDFFDLQNVQILNGPQGTLFGRNTLGGAFLMTTTAPSTQFGGYAQASVGNYHRLDSQGALNMPYTDTLTSRFTFNTSDVDGYINDIYDNRTHNDVHEKAARYDIRFQPGGAFSADLLGALGENHDNGDELIERSCNPNAVYTKDYAQAHANDIPATPGYCTQFPPLGLPYTIYGTATANLPNPLYNSGPNTNPKGSPLTGPLLGPSGLGMPHAGGFTPYTEGRVGTVILHLTGVVSDALTLKSITGLRYSYLGSYRDDGTPAGLYTESNGNWFRHYTEELQALLNAFGGRLTAVAGLYYYHADTTTIQDTGPDYDDPVGYYYANRGSQRSEAGYLQVTGAVTQKFSIIGGIRYTEDWKDTASKVWEGCYGSYIQEYQAYQLGGPGAYSGGCWIPGPTGNDYAAATNRWHHTDPRLQLQFQWTPDVMSYVSATSGYLAGGFNAQLPFFPPPGIPPDVYYNRPFQQETVWNYEFGTKGEWFNHRLRIDLAGFDQIFNNYQAGVLLYYGPEGISTVCTTGNCIDVTTTTSAADAHERGAEVEVDAIPVNNMTVQLTYSYLTQGFDAIFPNALAAGLRKQAALTSAPNKTFGFTGNYTFHLGSGATIVPAVNFRYVGNQFQGTYPLQFQAPGYGLLGANLSYNSPGNKWSVGLWGNNLLDRYYYQSYVPFGYVDRNMGDARINPGVPREWGLTFRWNY
jgi:iron complex outermembrane receptor protein